MKRERFISAMTATALSFCLGYGGTAAMVTGLELEANLWALLAWCLVSSAVFGLLLCHPKGGFAVGGVVLSCVIFAVSRYGFRQDLYSMLGLIGSYYDNGYGIGVPELFLESTGWSHLMPLVLIHVLVSALTCWSLVRRYPMVLAVALAALPMVSCFVVVDTVPALWCILLWLFGLIVILMTHPVRQRDEGHGNRLARIVALPVAAALVVLSLCIPKQGYETPQFSFVDLSSLWDWMDGNGGQGYLPSERISLSESLDLGALGERKLSNTPVMEVSANFSGTVYLRGRDYDRYDSKSWHASNQRTESDFMTAQNFHDTGKVTIRTLKRFNQYFIPYYPGESVIFRDGMVDNPEGATEYSFECVEPDQYQYGTKPLEYDTVAQRYLELPEYTREEAEKIVTWLTFMDGGNTAIANMVCNYVQSSAQYDLNTPSMPSDQEDFALWFLRESDTGYCVHFASAATVLLRAAGVPARYVEGYILNASVGRVTTVTERSAHAWTEYYEPGIGWVILEATPGYGEIMPTEPPETTEPTETEPTETEPTEPSTDPTEPPETTEPSQTTAPTETTAPDSTEQTGPGTSEKESFRLPGWVVTVLKVLGVLLLGIALVVLHWFLRRRRILGRMHRGSTNAQALARYREARRLSRFLKTSVPGSLESLAERACYSQHQITVEQLHQFNEYLQQCTNALRQKRLPLRLWCRFVLVLY